MSETESLELIRRTFSHVAVSKIELVEDREFGRIAKVHVPDAELSLALGDNGENTKRAATLSGMDVEVVIAERQC
jgi:transcription antitermination factor NusA-like protein